MCMKGHSLDDIPPELTPLEKARRLLTAEAEKTRVDFDDAIGTPFL